MTLIKHLAIAALASVIIVPTVSAEGSFYGGISYGNAKNSKGPCNKAEEKIKCDKEDNGFKIVAGIQAFDFLAFELDYLDLGESNFTLRGYPYQGIPTNLDNGKTTYEGWGASIVPSIKIIDNLKAFGRLGFINSTVETKTDVSPVDNSPVQFADFKSSSRDTDMSGRWGVGLQYDINEQFAVRIEYEELRDLGNDETGEVDDDFTSAGVIYKF
jgi:opacity protein-like surface antigen